MDTLYHSHSYYFFLGSRLFVVICAEFPPPSSPGCFAISLHFILYVSLFMGYGSSRPSVYGDLSHTAFLAKLNLISEKNYKNRKKSNRYIKFISFVFEVEIDSFHTYVIRNKLYLHCIPSVIKCVVVDVHLSPSIW